MFNPGLSIGQILKNADIVGKQVKHKTFDVGVITGIRGASIEVKFDKAGKKLLKFI